jgi:DUF4097 and DUF4098 domain-containing protein YvlB
MPERPLPEQPRPGLTVTTASGSVVITGEDRPDVAVEGNATVESGEAGEVVVRAKSSSLDVRCPTGTDVIVGTASGKVELRGRLGDARVTTNSSSIRVEHVQALELRSSSGSIDVATCDGRCRLRTTSGSVRVEEAGDVDISTESSSIRVEWAGGGRVHTVSGSVELGSTGVSDLDVRSISGSVEISLASGIRPRLVLRTVSGKARCDCEEGDDVRVAVSSVSGSVKVVPDS